MDVYIFLIFIKKSKSENSSTVLYVIGYIWNIVETATFILLSNNT